MQNALRDRLIHQSAWKVNSLRDYILDARWSTLYTLLMRRGFPIPIGFSGVFGNPLRLVSDLLREQVLHSLIVGEVEGPFLFGSLLSSSHSGDLPC